MVLPLLMYNPIMKDKFNKQTNVDDIINNRDNKRGWKKEIYGYHLILKQ